MSKTADIVNGYQHALGQGDIAGARKLLSDKLSFRGPFDSFEAPEPYLEALKKLHPMVKGVKVHKLFVDESDACLLYGDRKHSVVIESLRHHLSLFDEETNSNADADSQQVEVCLVPAALKIGIRPRITNGFLGCVAPPGL